MMSNSWFPVASSIVDRTDLSVYEKMCLIVLSRYVGREEFDYLLTKDVIAKKMGCNRQQLEEAISGLMEKGLMDSEDEARFIRPLEYEEFGDLTKPEPPKSDVPAKKPRKPRKKAEPKTENKVGSEKPTVEPKSQPKGRVEPTFDLIDGVYQIIDEKINEREAKIILNFADNNLERIKEKYAIAKKSQISDKIELLINELQKKDSDVKPAVATTGPREIKPIINGQINLVNYSKIQNYKNAPKAEKK